MIARMTKIMIVLVKWRVRWCWWWGALSVIITTAIILIIMAVMLCSCWCWCWSKQLKAVWSHGVCVGGNWWLVCILHYYDDWDKQGRGTFTSLEIVQEVLKPVEMIQAWSNWSTCPSTVSYLYLYMPWLPWAHRSFQKPLQPFKPQSQMLGCWATWLWFLQVTTLLLRQPEPEGKPSCGLALQVDSLQLHAPTTPIYRP